MFNLSRALRLRKRTPNLDSPQSCFSLDQKFRIFLQRTKLSLHCRVELAQAFASVYVSRARARKSRREDGFILVFFLTLLPVLMAFAFAMSAGGLMIADRRQAMNECRATLLSGLRKASTPMLKILALNKEAQALQASEVALTAALAVASASGNVAAIAKIGADLVKVEEAKETLDTTQKALYAEASADLAQAQTDAFSKVSASSQWLKMTAFPFPPMRPAIRPLSPAPGSEWEKLPHFSVAQRLDQKWQWKFEIGGVARRFIQASRQQEETCSATLNDVPVNWRAEIR